MLKRIFFILLATLSISNIFSKEEIVSKGHMINFSDVPIVEFIKFVSKIAEKTFVFKVDELDFKVSFISGKTASSHSIMQALFQILDQHHFKVKEEKDYVLIEKMSDREIKSKIGGLLDLKQTAWNEQKTQLSAYTEDYLEDPYHHNRGFYVYKLQYHKGSEILQTIKQLVSAKKTAHDLQQAAESLQWVEATNSLVFSSEPSSAVDIQNLIKSIDTAQKQVFIEVLVIETDAKAASEFGLEWGGTGHIKNKLGFGFGNFAPHGGSLLAQNLQAGSNQVPFGKGFDLGVIGDLILHKGRSFLSLGALISALEKDGKISIVLNQKIITQDNKSSSIFVGDNIPFTGSVVQTIGASQQTLANIEYRDIGVSLQITPLLGDSDIITLDIKEEITEARDDLRDLDTRANGIQTTKTNMVTRVHVPDKNFLVLSGMVKNSKIHRKSGLPCLGGLPWIGAAFSKKKIDKEKKNILIFVRPQIVHSFENYQAITAKEERAYNAELDSKNQVNFKPFSDE